MANSISGHEVLEALHWRYAVKKFDPTKQISDADWQTLKECLRQSPSSSGLQPWKFLPIESKAMREKLKPHAHNQPQITDASHLIVFAYRTDTTEADINAFAADTQAKRPMMPPEKIKAFRDSMVNNFVNSPKHEVIATWASRQLYIALGVLLTSAAMMHIDACPMEGFITEEFDELLGLKNLGFASAALCALGYRSADDHFAKLPKVRFNADQVFDER